MIDLNSHRSCSPPPDKDKSEEEIEKEHKRYKQLMRFRRFERMYPHLDPLSTMFDLHTDEGILAAQIHVDLFLEREHKRRHEEYIQYLREIVCRSLSLDDDACKLVMTGKFDILLLFVLRGSLAICINRMNKKEDESCSLM